jgi:adenosylmethionine-8-amino-7-oxononanoate aminotransferase
MLAPPFIVTEAEIDEIVTRFTRALARTMREVVVPAKAV